MDTEDGGQSRRLCEKNQVVLRLRPVPSLPPAEVAQAFGCAGTLSWAERRVDLPDGVSCCFDEVFGEAEPPESVFRDALQHLVDGCFDGYNGTLFTWGAPGTGKTTTVFGQMQTDDAAETDASFSGRSGLAQLAVQRLFGKLKEHCEENPGVHGHVNASVLELGGLEVVDLLSERDERDVLLSRSSLFDGATTVEATSADSLLEILRLARQRHKKRRRSLPSGLNRRHCIFSVGLELDSHDSKGTFTSLAARLSLVDLAGAAEGAEQTRASSASTLADLMQVIEALADRGSDKPVPYGASPLTQMMQDALGGNCRTVMLLTAAGSAEALKAEVFLPASALQVATHVQKVVNHPVPNYVRSGEEAPHRRNPADLPEVETENCASPSYRISSRSAGQLEEIQLESDQSSVKRNVDGKEGSDTSANAGKEVQVVLQAGDPPRGVVETIIKDNIATHGSRSLPFTAEANNGEAVAHPLMQLVADDSVFDMSLDSEGFPAAIDAVGNVFAQTMIPATSTPTSPVDLVAALSGPGLSPIAKAPSPIMNPHAGLSVAANVPATVKPPAIPRPDLASALKEALQVKLAEIPLIGASVASRMTSDASVKTQLHKKNSCESSSTFVLARSNSAASDSTASPCSSARIPTSTQEATSVTSTSHATAAAARVETRPELSPRHSERLLSMQALLEKRTVQLTKAQLRLQEATQRALRAEADNLRLAAKSENQAIILQAFECLLSLLLERQGPALLEDIPNLDPQSLAALRNFALAATNDAAPVGGDLRAEQEVIAEYDMAETPCVSSPLPWPAAAVAEAAAGDSVPRSPQNVSPQPAQHHQQQAKVARGDTPSPTSPLFGKEWALGPDTQRVRQSCIQEDTSSSHTATPQQPQRQPTFQPTPIWATSVEQMQLTVPHIAAAGPPTQVSVLSALAATYICNATGAHKPTMPTAPATVLTADPLKSTTVVIQPAQMNRIPSGTPVAASESTGASAVMEAYERSWQEIPSSHAQSPTPMSTVSPQLSGSQERSPLLSKFWAGTRQRLTTSPSSPEPGSVWRSYSPPSGRTQRRSYSPPQPPAQICRGATSPINVPPAAPTPISVENSSRGPNRIGDQNIVLDALRNVSRITPPRETLANGAVVTSSDATGTVTPPRPNTNSTPPASHASPSYTTIAKGTLMRIVPPRGPGSSGTVELPGSRAGSFVQPPRSVGPYRVATHEATDALEKLGCSTSATGFTLSNNSRSVTGVGVASEGGIVGPSNPQVPFSSSRSIDGTRGLASASKPITPPATIQLPPQVYPPACHSGATPFNQPNDLRLAGSSSQFQVHNCSRPSSPIGPRRNMHPRGANVAQGMSAASGWMTPPSGSRWSPQGPCRVSVAKPTAGIATPPASWVPTQTCTHGGRGIAAVPRPVTAQPLTAPSMTTHAGEMQTPRSDARACTVPPRSRTASAIHTG